MILDNDVYFDKETQRYYLTESYVLNKMGTDLSVVADDEFDTNVDTLNKRTIEYACDIVYDFLENNAISKQSARYLVTQSQEAYNSLKNALKYQLFDFIQVGDVSTERGNKASDTVNIRAVQSLKKANLFNTIISTIPTDVDKW